WVDSTDLIATAEALTPNTKLILVETPTNPLQQITDLRALAELAQAHDVLLAVDNSLMSPWLQQPLSLGADLVIHSATKHLAGHSDLTAGVIAVNDKQLAEHIGFIQNATGTALAPFDCWLLLRGIKTLGLRLERQQANAQRVAEFLAEHAAVKKVYYPGLKSHSGYELHRQQARGAGNLISFETGSFDGSCSIVDTTELFAISVSFGCIQSLISLPCQMSHAAIPSEKCHLAKDLIRLSIGIEDPDDLIADLKAAFDKSAF
ncbi:MAG: PLP-dependent transferase, partial [Gammaproteobacteria bacterium]